MNGKLGLSGLSIIFAVAILSACGGNSGGGSSSAPPADNSTTTPPPNNPSGSQRPDSVAGFVYAVNRISGNVSGYTINSTTGALSEVAGSPFPAGNDPIALAVHPAGGFVYVPNHVSNTLSAYAIDDATGVLTEVAGSPYPVGVGPWSVDIDPLGNFAYVVSGGYPKAGGSEPGKISGFSINKSTGELSEIAGSPFTAWAEATSITFNHSGNVAYLITSNSSSAGIHTLAVDTATGGLSEVGFTGMPGVSPTPLSITPSGNYAYVANQQYLVSYKVDPATGALSKIEPDVVLPSHSGPMSSLIDPSGKFVYAAGSFGKVSAFSIEPANGRLSEVPGSPFAAGDSLNNFIVDPTGKFAYAANSGAPGYISAFTIDASTGTLSEIAGSPFSDGGNPNRLTIDPTGRVAYAVNCDSNDTCDISGYAINTTSGALTSVGRVPSGQYTVAIAITGVH